MTVLIGCEKDDPSDNEDPKADRTVLIYMAAQNNLNSYAHYDCFKSSRAQRI